MRKTKRILLLSPRISTPANYPPLGLMYIQSYLKSKGYTNVKLHDFRGTGDRKAERIIREYGPDIVGISCLTSYRMNSIRLAEITKKVNPKTTVVLGGIHATLMYKQILENFPAVDILVLGEGEITFYELTKTIEENSDISKVASIAYRDSRNEIVVNSSREMIRNLDDIPFPCYDDVTAEDYPGHETYQGNIVSSRGCTFSCQFCSTSRFWGRRWRARSAKNVVDEIEWLIENQGIKGFFFWDDIFSIDKKRVIEICKEIINRKLGIQWGMETRADCVSKEMFEWIKKAGCEKVKIGVESGSDTILRNINKGVSIDENRKALSWAKEVGFKVNLLLMVGNPGETWGTIDESKRLIHETEPDNITISILYIYPGTPIYEIAKSKGKIADNYWLTNKLQPVFDVELKESELIAMRTSIVIYFLKQKGLVEFVKYVISQIIFNLRRPIRIYEHLTPKTLYKLLTRDTTKLRSGVNKLR